jgi:hypothetical protein
VSLFPLRGGKASLRAWRQSVGRRSLPHTGRPLPGGSCSPAVGRERSDRLRQVQHALCCAQGPPTPGEGGGGQWEAPCTRRSTTARRSVTQRSLACAPRAPHSTPLHSQPALPCVDLASPDVFFYSCDCVAGARADGVRDVRGLAGGHLAGDTAMEKVANRDIKGVWHGATDGSLNDGRIQNPSNHLGSCRHLTLYRGVLDIVNHFNSTILYHQVPNQS